MAVSSRHLQELRPDRNGLPNLDRLRGHSLEELFLFGKGRSNLSPREVLNDGNIPPLITPLNAKGEVDLHAIEKIVNYVHSLGVKHIFVMGETGEFRFLTNLQRRTAILGYINAAKKHDMVVFANATAEDFNTTKDNWRWLALAGADAAVIAPCWGADNRKVFDYVKKCRDKGTSLPLSNLVVYDNPHITNGEHIHDSELRKGSGVIIALKDSWGKEDRFDHLASLGSELGYLAYQGNEIDILERLRKRSEKYAFGGSVGSMGGVNDLIPLLFTANSPDEQQVVQDLILSTTPLYTTGRQKIIASIKEIYYQLGIISTPNVAPGTASLTPEEAAVIQTALREQRIPLGRIELGK